LIAWQQPEARPTRQIYIAYSWEDASCFRLRDLEWFRQLIMNIFILARTITYAALFIGLLFIYLPGRLLSWSGIVEPELTGTPQIAGMIAGGVGSAIALWCIFAFVFVGKGTPAAFDPPRRLVIAGPYRFVRNPMYIGAGLTLAGAALFYESISIAIYAGLFLLTAHLFVVFYEEPTLRRMFGSEYDAYCASVRRWRPGWAGSKPLHR
jgi:protein-S-isoprenylcysteine O-methyltransferase Ste14